MRAVTADIKTFQKVSRAGGAGLEVTPDAPRDGQRQYGLKGPVLPAEVLHAFPGPLPRELEESLPAFCLPHGVRPELLERTPSMSALNEVIYSQPYQTHDDHSFVFLMKVGRWRRQKAEEAGEEEGAVHSGGATHCGTSGWHNGTHVTAAESRRGGAA